MFSFDEAVSAVKGNVVNRRGPSGPDVFISGVSTDTRTIKKNDLYVALRGENFNGEDFTADACRKGACAVVVSSADRVPSGCVGIIVDDTLKALGDLARHYRFKLKAKVIAVTGSVGKTTTRELIRTALEPSFNVVSTMRNLNNEIGLPMTILGAPRDTQVMVLEMGMRGRGQISYLADIARPDIAVITNVGYSHIGILGSREEIRAAKTEIIDGLTQNGVLIVNGDDEFLFDYARRIIPQGKGLAAVSSGGDFERKLVNGDIANCSSYAVARNVKEDDGMAFDACISTGAGEDLIKGIRLSLGGEHNVRNACFAMLCASLSGADIGKAVRALSEYEPMDGRGRTFRGRRYTIINDAYNASPESMKAAFANLNLTAGAGRKIAVLGGMLELGDQSEKLHEQTGKDLGKYDFEKIIVTGEDAPALIRGLRSVRPSCDVALCGDTKEVEAKVREIIRDGDTILFKASHSFGFEGLAREFIENDEG